MKKMFVMAAMAATLMACQESLEEKAAQEARLYTRKNCPAQMTDNLIMDSLGYETGTRTMHFYYRLTGVADSVGMMNKETVRQSLLSELKNTTSMQAYKDAGFNFAYTYRSEKHPDVVLYDVVFTEKDYGKK